MANRRHAPPSYGSPQSPPMGFGDDPGGGWLPVSAAPSGTRAARPGDCWNCGQANPRGREYCRRCGQRLDSDLGATADRAGIVPVGGGRGRRALMFILSVIIVAGLVAVGVVAFGGFMPRVTPAAPTPTLTAAIVPTAAASPSASPAPTAAPSVKPTTTPRATLPVVAPGSPLASGLPTFALPSVALPTPVRPTPSTPTATSGMPTGSVRPVATPTPVPAVTPTPTATASVVATPTAGPTPTPAPVLTPRPTPTPASSPTPVPTPTRRPLSTATPGPITTTASPRAPGPVAFSCADALSLRDPLNRGWKLSGVFWAQRDTFDRVTLRLIPDPTRDGGETRVNVSTHPFSDLTDLGLPQPAEGDQAVVIRFSNTVSLLRALQATADKTAVRTVQATTSTKDTRIYAVLGVLGKGCTALQVPAWQDPSSQHTPFVDITVDVQH